MCGIIGVVGGKEIVESIVDGLHRLEYRGYDSAGVATIDNGKISRLRAEGKLRNLEHALFTHPIGGTVGIGHTRWATHGAPVEANAHPHATEDVAVVHNGIIENYKLLKTELQAKGYTFLSETDSEVVPVLITDNLRQGMSSEEAFSAAIQRLEGAFALGVVMVKEPHRLFAARKGSPLAVGYGDGEMYMGSDAVALAPLTTKVAYLEEGDWAVISPDSAVYFDASGKKVHRTIKITAITGASVGKGNYRHFMLKEIFEQPTVIGEVLHTYYNPKQERIVFDEAVDAVLDGVERITLIACGTSYYAGMIAKYWIERIAGVPVNVDVASEFRYRHPPLSPKELLICVSQSGETADTLAALRMAKSQGLATLAIVNVMESTMAREADAALSILAGPEIGVASTKAFTAQLTVMACLALQAAYKRGTLSADNMKKHVQTLFELPARITEMLESVLDIETIAAELIEVKDAIYIGRGVHFPIALEGALKLKEISYIHAEGYAAGELKHGPIALIDEHMPVIVIAPSDELFEKTVSNMQEVAARDGIVILLTDAEGARNAGDVANAVVTVPDVDAFAAPIMYSIPVQLLAYYVAVHKGTDVDQPRNLAKSVTVE